MDSVEDLRLSAKSFCSTPDEWHHISMMNKGKLLKFIAEKEFLKNQDLKLTFFSGIHRILAYAADTVTRANGHVQKQMLVDLPLQQAIEDEALPLIQYLNNRSKILMLFVHDVIQGKVTQRLLEPNIVIEENGDCQDITDLVEPIQDISDGYPKETETENAEKINEQVSGFD